MEDIEIRQTIRDELRDMRGAITDALTAHDTRTRETGERMAADIGELKAEVKALSQGMSDLNVRLTVTEQAAESRAREAGKREGRRWGIYTGVVVGGLLLVLEAAVFIQFGLLP